MLNNFNNAYVIYDSRKFITLEDAKKEAEKLRSVVRRIKKNTGNIAKVTVYISEIDIKNSIGSYQYSTSKKFGGKKMFCGRLKAFVEPHIHLIVEGYGCCALSEDIRKYLAKNNPAYMFSKKHLKTQNDIYKFINL